MKKFKLLLCFTLFFIFLFPSLSFSQEQELRIRLENLSAEIRMDASAVGQVLREAMDGKFGEIHKWQAIDEKMQALEASIDKNLPEIESTLRELWNLDPNFNPPKLTIGNIFEGNLEMVTRKKQELNQLAIEENKKLQTINARIDKTNQDILKASKGLIVDTIESLLPDEASLAAEGTVIVLGAYFGPPGITAATIAWGAVDTFNNFIELYYNIKAAADQAKVLTDMLKGLTERRAQIQKNLDALMEGVREMYSIEKILEKHKKKLDSIKAKIFAAEERLKGVNQDSFAQKKKKIEEKISKAKSSPAATYGVAIWPFSDQEVPPLKADEYMGEAESIISELESYTKAVEDGGDPENFNSRIADLNNKLVERREKAHKVYKDAYNSAKSQMDLCWVTYNRADKSTFEASKAAYDAYISCCKAAVAPVLGPYREYIKTIAAGDIVNSVVDLFRQRVRNAIASKKKEFWDSYSLWERKLYDANRKVYTAFEISPYEVKHYKAMADRINEYVNRALDEGADVKIIKNNLLNMASKTKDLDKKMKDGLIKYNEAYNQATLVSNIAKGELKSLLNKWGYLIAHSDNVLSWSGVQKIEYTPRRHDSKWLEERIKEDFKVYEMEDMKEVLSFDLASIASIFERKAEELRSYTDWADTYRHRLSAAIEPLNNISFQKTGYRFYAHRDCSILKKELTSPPWSQIAHAANKFITKDDYAQLPYKFGAFEDLNIPQKLLSAQQSIYYKLDKLVPFYIRSGSNVPIAALEVIKPYEDQWKELRKLCEEYEAIAKKARDDIANVYEEIQKIAQPVIKTYFEMPSTYKILVGQQHYVFRNSYECLLKYFKDKADAVRPILPSNFTEALDWLLLDYTARFYKYKRELEDRERELEERKKMEQEKVALLAREKQLITDLYNKFKQAYESRNDSLVMSFIGDGWSAGDGTTIADLHDNLKRTFKIYNEIRYNIQNFNITNITEKLYQVSYDVTITSRIYARNIKHEEKSSVVEEVIIEGPNRAKINRTISGRFWYIE